jgi:predicted metalloprotease
MIVASCRADALLPDRGRRVAGRRDFQKERAVRWDQQRQSDNVEDRRGMSTGGRIGGLGIGGLILLMVLGYLVKGDPLALLNSATMSSVDQGAPAQQGGAPPANDESSKFIRAVVGSTEDVWGQLFQQMGRRYQNPRLVMFSGAVDSACGMTSAAVGPFYCPGDQQVYIDLSFYRELEQKFGAPGDFARAYVIAHEVGHHVQNQLGIGERVDAARSRASEAQANALSVRQELQADCFAGVWGYHVANSAQKGIQLDQGDVEQGLAAAAAIGDDRLQRQAQGQVSPESWTHGSSQQRVTWLRRGLQSGRVDSCDTFAANAQTQ